MAPEPKPDQSPPWWHVIVAAARHWLWLVGAAVVCALLGLGLGRHLWGTHYTATAQLMRYDTPDPQLFQPRTINPATLVGMTNSPEVRNRVGARLDPVLTGDQVGARVRITPVPTTELVNVAVSAPDPATATAQANIYAEEAVKFTQEMQARDARDAASYLRHQLTQVDADIAALAVKFQQAGTAPTAPVATGVSAYQTRLDAARVELGDLQSRYTDAHPLVQMQLARVAALEKQMSAPAAPAANAGTAAPAVTAGGDLDLLREKMRSLEVQRREVTVRLQITELLAENPPGHFKFFSPAAAERAVLSNPNMKIALFAIFLGLCGLGLGVIGAVTDEALDRRLRTPDDVRRVTQLPVIARLGPIDKMSPEDRARWSFRTWTALQSRLSPTPNQGLVCGITSSTPKEGRSTWIKFLAEAASQCGFRVVVLATRPENPADDESRPYEPTPAPTAAASSARFQAGQSETKHSEAILVQETTLSPRMLGNLGEMVDEIIAAESQGTSIVHIPLPGWVWNLAHRREWLASLNAWSNQENVVVLVELPPASHPESVLLAQNLPNVLWLSDAMHADALETQRQIETLRLARCNIVGAVMNRSNGTNLQERFARWMPVPAMAALALTGLLTAAPVASAQAVEEPAGAFSIVSPAQRGAWQQKLTLGPGDVLRIALYGEPKATRSEVTVQPDGRISFLEAQDVVANGLTVDQLREELDRQLGNFRRSARTMISPVAFRSKKYHMLGLVSQKGSFTLDRPMTVVEAVARARGFETSAASGDVTELADLKHAFLVRNGERKPVDFVRLFTAGDLSQNIAVEPGDYFYFPPASLREVYVLGEIAQPGPAALGDQGTSLRAIAARGGFTNRAWRDRVLVVRGSLSEPKPMIVNLADVLAGRAPDIALEPSDIIYVSAKPWAKAEELLDEAVKAFAQGFVFYWTSDRILPLTPTQQ